MGNDFNKTLGGKIAEARKAKNMNQTELAQKLGISKQVISNWERGCSPVPTNAISALSDILSCPIPYFFSESDTPLPPISESEMLLLTLYRSNKEFHSVIEKLIGAYSHDIDKDGVSS